MKRLINFILLSCCLLLCKLKASDPTLVPNIPKSPEVASFMRYMESPISLYTGTVDVSIPLYTIEVDNIKVPITLSYHNAGAKVEEEASWVGLGWNLNAGGCIFRAIKNIPDDFPRGWLTDDDMTLNYPSSYNWSSDYFAHDVVYCNCCTLVTA